MLSLTEDVRRGGARPGRDLTDEADLDPLGELLRSGTHLELDGAVDVGQVLQAAVEPEEAPGPRGPPVVGIFRRMAVRGERDRVDEPGALEEALDALLADKLV